MVSNVCLTGYLTGNTKGKFRFLNIERTPIKEREKVIDSIPIAYWNPSPNSRLLHLKEGTLVMIIGRLERDEEIGIYIMCERLEYISPGEGVDRITIM